MALGNETASQADVVSVEVKRRAGWGARVIVDDPTKHLAASDCAAGWRWAIGYRAALFNALVRARLIVIPNVLLEDA